MYHIINTIVPKKRYNAIAYFSVLIGLVIAGYVMIALIVMVDTKLQTINDKMDNAEIMVCNTRMDLSQFSK